MLGSYADTANRASTMVGARFLHATERVRPVDAPELPSDNICLYRTAAVAHIGFIGSSMLHSYSNTANRTYTIVGTLFFHVLITNVKANWPQLTETAQFLGSAPLPFLRQPIP